jgi:predicted RNA-binding protein with RPS1 domain
MQVERIGDLLQDGDELNVVVVGRDQRGNLRLSRKPLLGTADDQIVRKQVEAPFDKQTVSAGMQR